jgi:HTH-type transcriptional regulator/antitoxin MqsA
MSIKHTTVKHVCSACGEGNLSEKTASDVMEYMGTFESVEYMYLECDVCGSELAESKEILFNNRKVTEFHKRVDGLLSGNVIRANREQYHITQDLAASLFGGGKVAFSRYENNDVVQSVSMDSLIRLCFENPHNLLLLAKHRHVELKAELVELIENQYYKDVFETAQIAYKSLENELSIKLTSADYASANDQYSFDDLEFRTTPQIRVNASRPEFQVCTQ